MRCPPPIFFIGGLIKNWVGASHAPMFKTGLSLVVVGCTLGDSPAAFHELYFSTRDSLWAFSQLQFLCRDSDFSIFRVAFCCLTFFLAPPKFCWDYFGWRVQTTIRLCFELFNLLFCTLPKRPVWLAAAITSLCLPLMWLNTLEFY